MKGYVFPGQGSQYVGMGKALYDHSSQARELFKIADQILAMDLTQIMLEGDQPSLKETAIAQPAIFVHSVISAFVSNDFYPAALAGHSLGELSALVAGKVIPFEHGLHLVALRAKAMQKACQIAPGTMAAVIGLKDAVVETICKNIQDEIVVPANYNCPGQLVISGSHAAISLAAEALVQAGARKVIPLQVAGAFHSPFMAHAQKSFATALTSMPFSKPICPIYQNITGLPVSEPEIIKQNLIQHLTSPIYWTKTINSMIQDGISMFIECGPGAVLQGLNRKIAPALSISPIALPLGRACTKSSGIKTDI